MHDLLQRLTSLTWDQASQWLFLIPAALMLLAGAAAVMLRNLIHCALCLALSFIALGVLFIALGAEFVGLIQLLVYVGAVTMLILFAILLTPAGEVTASNNPLHGFKFSRAINATFGGSIAAMVLVGLLAVIFFSPMARKAVPPEKTPALPVAAIGVALVGQKNPETGIYQGGNYMLPLQGIAVLLTAALIGAALLAKEEKQL